jgi:murein DD-endopeptidase MepM/ murein hydrolase activator NlpD
VRTVIFPADRSAMLRLSLIALVAGLGACSSIDSLRSPVFTGSTNNQKEIIAGTDSPLGGTYYGSQAAGVQGADLPPPAGAQTTPQYAAAPSPARMAAPATTSTTASAQSRPQPYTPPSSRTASTTPRRTTQVASAEPQHAQRGAPPTTLGEQAARIEQSTPSGSAGTHLVQSGDTAWNISQRYGITVDELAAANGGSTTVRLGQRLVIPGASGASPQGTQLASLNPTEVPAPPAAPLPEAPTAAAPKPAAAPIQQTAVAPQTGNAGSLAPVTPEPSTAATAGFRWPVRGRIISGFGKKPNGERNDGINLAVPEGTSVKAAEDGTVIYAGNELKSYGNLVLIRHANGWVSAYAHNSKLEVKRGDQVKRGQVIALSGMSGGVTTPQVHFELRKDAAPVDPLQHLSET